jgi:hypothetical protein
MKKPVLTLLLLHLLMSIIYGQYCLPCSATLQIDENNLLTDLVAQGIRGQSISSADNDAKVFGHSTLWVGGLDPVGNLKLAGEIPEKDGSDFYPGPLDSSTGQIDSLTCQNWDRFFVMTRDIVLDHQRLYTKYVIDQGTRIPDDSISVFIKSWPAEGNPYFEELMGFSLPSRARGLAPFWDDAESEIYDPGLGSFPIIWNNSFCTPETRAEAIARVPDEFAFWIFNDAGDRHNNSQGYIINVEIYGMAFANDTEGAVGNSIIHTYKLRNYGSSDVMEASVGLNLNPQIGCSDDDYFGIEPDRNLFYSYNQDSSDGSNNCICAGGEQSWCDEIPMHGIKIVEEIASFTVPIDTIVFLDATNLSYYNICSDSITAIDGTCMPVGAEEYYELLKGNFTDGTQVTQGGTGYDINSTDVTNFVFPNAPDSGDWSMCSDSLVAGDRRPFMTTGPFLLKQGVEFTYSYASFFVEGADYPCPSLDLLLDADEQLEEYRNNCYVIERDDEVATSTEDTAQQSQHIQLYPNPFDDHIFLDSEEPITSIRVFNGLGKIVLEANTEQLPNNRVNTADLSPGIYFIRVNNQEQLLKLMKTR